MSRSRYAPSDVPSASKMKERISEVFGSSKAITYSDQDPYPGILETSIPVHHHNVVSLRQSLVPRSSSLLTAPRFLLENSPSKAAARRRVNPSPLPPSSPPSSSGVDETEEHALDLHRHSTRNIKTDDQYGLLRGNQKFRQLRRRHVPQKNIGGPPSASPLGRLENLSPITPCVHTTSTSVSSRKGSGDFALLFAHSKVEPMGGQQRRKGNYHGPHASEGDSETLSGLLARLPRGRRHLQRQRQDSPATDDTGTSASTTIEPPKTAVEKERGKQRRKTRAADEASHLKGQDRVGYEERRDARLAHYREVDAYRMYEEDVLWI